ncbi:MAG: hypothetical protein R3D43_06415 [Tepidamorphaceae bacterium]
MARNRSLRRKGRQPVSPGFRKPPGPVRRRRIVYIAGYDPRPPEGATYSLLKREVERYCENRPVSFDLSPVAHAPDGETASWTLALEAEGWRCEAEYLFLRWDDIVARDFARWFPERVLRSFVTLLDYLLSGTLFAMGKAFHRTAILWLYPFIAIAGILALAVLAGLWAADAFSGAAMGTAAGIAVFVVVAAIGAWFTRFTFIQHLADLWCFLRDFAIGKRPDMEARCERFADYVLDAVRRDDVDETILVGHSYGTMMVVEATARALARDADAFSSGSPVSVLTLGSCINTSSLHPRAQARKASVSRVAGLEHVMWAEIQGRQDMINYFQDDPAVAAGLPEDDTRANPVVRTFSLRDVLSGSTYNRFSLNYFRMHFQTICANDVSHPWDYFLAVAGPDPLAGRLSLDYWRERERNSKNFLRQSVPVLAAFPDLPRTPSN